MRPTKSTGLRACSVRAVLVSILVTACNSAAEASTPPHIRQSHTVMSSPAPAQLLPVSIVTAWKLLNEAARRWSPDAQLLQVTSIDAGDPDERESGRGADGLRAQWQGTASAPRKGDTQGSFRLANGSITYIEESPPRISSGPIWRAPAIDSPSAARSAQQLRPSIDPGSAKPIGWSYVAERDEKGQYVLDVFGRYRSRPAKVEFNADTGVRIGAFVSEPQSTLFRSTDYGTTWSNIGPPGVFIRDILADSTYFYAVTDRHDGIAVERSADTGMAWQQASALPPGNARVAYDAATTGRVLWLGTDEGLWNLDLSTGTWSPTNRFAGSAVEFVGIRNGTIAIGVAQGATGSYILNPHSGEWTSISANCLRPSVVSSDEIWFLDQNLATASSVKWTRGQGGENLHLAPGTQRVFSAGDSATVVAETTTGLAISFDDGVSWQTAISGEFTGGGVSSDEGTIAFAEARGYVALSRDRGRTWTEHAVPGLNSADVGAMAASGPSIVLAATGGSVWSPL